MAVQDWNAAFEATPAGTDQVSEGDDRIRELKQTVRAELVVEHDTGATSTDYTDSGRHKVGSARAFCDLGSVAAPATLMRHSNAGAWPPTVAETDITAGASSDLDNGRLWVDWDDCQPFVREQEITGAAWTDINTNHGDGAGGAPGVGLEAANWLSLWPRTFTLTDVANDNDEQPAASNAREGISSAAGVGGVLGVSVDCPDDGRDYEIVVTATCTYHSSDGEAVGFWLVEDGGAAVDVDFKFAIKEDANGNTGELTLTRVQDSPTNGTTYDYTVEFATTDHTSANCVANPDAATYGLGGDFIAGVLAGVSWSRISATLKPRYLVASYTQV